MHPWLILGIFIFELPFPWKHKINQQDTEKVKENDLDTFPEPDNAFDPIHGVKLEYLLQLLTPPSYFCSIASILLLNLKIMAILKTIAAKLQ